MLVKIDMPTFDLLMQYLQYMFSTHLVFIAVIHELPNMVISIAGYSKTEEEVCLKKNEKEKRSKPNCLAWSKF